MRTKRLLAGVFAGGTALAVLGGCAAQQIQALEPRLELRDAVQQLTGIPQAGFTLKLTPTTSVYGEIGRTFKTGHGDAQLKASVQGSVGVKWNF